jgi:putative transposase
LIGKHRIDKQLVCPQTGEVVDRDHNAARNLRDWPDHASCGPVRATAPLAPGPTESVGTGRGADLGPSGACGAPIRPRSAGPGAERPESNRRQRRGEPCKGTPREWANRAHSTATEVDF